MQTPKKKITVGILFGGKSVEHEVSVRSAANIAAALNPEKYEVVLFPIGKNGEWFLAPGSIPKLPQKFGRSLAVAILPPSSHGIISVASQKHSLQKIDVFFPVLHGTNGEDGTIQGLLKLADVPFVGPNTLASAVGMDKDVTKRLWRDAGLPVGKFVCIMKEEKVTYSQIARKLGDIVFVKPANAGSSVGVSKVRNAREFQKALALAFRYDSKILIEEFLDGREIEVAVLGNEKPKASLPGEIIPHHDFYSYEAKYLDENGAGLEIPARLTQKQTQDFQDIALQAFTVLGAEGLARIDFFLRKNDGKIFLNEINTLPGFTSVSMYPKLWEASGIPPQKLVDELVRLAIIRHQREKRLETNFLPEN